MENGAESESIDTPTGQVYDKPEKEYKNMSEEVWTSSFIDLKKVLVISGPADYVEGHMLICRGYVKVFWGLQLVTYTLGTAVAMFLYPMYASTLAGVGIGLMLGAGISWGGKY